jgi:hypothetical protein
VSRGLRGHHNIGAISRRAQGDRQTDAAARAGDEKSLALKRHKRFLAAFSA